MPNRSRVPVFGDGVASAVRGTLANETDGEQSAKRLASGSCRFNAGPIQQQCGSTFKPSAGPCAR